MNTEKVGEEKVDEYYVPGLKVPCNWDLSLLSKLGEINKHKDKKFAITEVYASLPYSTTGSGRGGNSIQKPKHPLEVYVNESHRNGLKFCYLMNAISMGGKEWKPEVENDLYAETQGLVTVGVDSITVAIPSLALKLKNAFPEIEITSSVNNHIDSVERARQYIEHTGVKNLILDNRCSRNFPLMKAIRKEFPASPITVLVNESCLPDCLLQSHHQEYLASISRKGNLIKVPDVCHMLCARTKLKNPIYAMKAPWVRPEDIHYLFDAGVTYIKLAGRTQNSNWIYELASMYSKGYYEGNIWPFIEKSGLTSPDWEELLDKKLEPCHYKVSNKALEGFLQPFVQGNVPCVKNNNGCGDCRWCEKWQHAVEYPDNAEERLSDLYTLLAKVTKNGLREPILALTAKNKNVCCHV